MKQVCAKPRTLNPQPLEFARLPQWIPADAPRGVTVLPVLNTWQSSTESHEGPSDRDSGESRERKQKGNWVQEGFIAMIPNISVLECLDRTSSR